MEYLKVLLTQRHEELEAILMNPTALPIAERACINAELKNINKALDDLAVEVQRWMTTKVIKQKPPAKKDQPPPKTLGIQNWLKGKHWASEAFWTQFVDPNTQREEGHANRTE